MNDDPMAVKKPGMQLDRAAATMAAVDTYSKKIRRRRAMMNELPALLAELRDACTELLEVTHE